MSVVDSCASQQTGAKRGPGRRDRCHLLTLCCKESERGRGKAEDIRDADCAGECVISCLLKIGRGVDGVEPGCEWSVYDWVEWVPLCTDGRQGETERRPDHGASSRDITSTAPVPA